MENMNLIGTFAEFKELKNVDRATMIRIIEDTFRSVMIKMISNDENFDIIINAEKCDLEIWRKRKVVKDGSVEDPSFKYHFQTLRKIDSDFELDEDVTTRLAYRLWPTSIVICDRICQDV